MCRPRFGFWNSVEFEPVKRSAECQSRLRAKWSATCWRTKLSNCWAVVVGGGDWWRYGFVFAIEWTWRLALSISTKRQRTRWKREPTCSSYHAWQELDGRFASRPQRAESDSLWSRSLNPVDVYYCYVLYHCSYCRCRRWRPNYCRCKVERRNGRAVVRSNNRRLLRCGCVDVVCDVPNRVILLFYVVHHWWYPIEWNLSMHRGSLSTEKKNIEFDAIRSRLVFYLCRAWWQIRLPRETYSNWLFRSIVLSRQAKQGTVSVKSCLFPSGDDIDLPRNIFVTAFAAFWNPMKSFCVYKSWPLTKLSLIIRSSSCSYFDSAVSSLSVDVERLLLPLIPVRSGESPISGESP